MARPKPIVDIVSFGIYTQWDNKEKALPKIRQFTLQVPAEIDIEFGLTVNIKKAKNRKVRFCIDHPGILDKKGHVMPPFEGEEYIRSNDWDFYLGDTLWDPLDDKVGPWRMTLELDDDIIAEKTFDVDFDVAYEGASFWKMDRPKIRRR